MPGTCSRSATEARSIAFRVPKWRRSARLRVGPMRKRALLRHFGTLKAIERASAADLEHVPGINAETARKIYDFFHESAPRR